MAAKRGLYANIHAKRKRIEAGSGEKMRTPGSEGAPTDANFKRAAQTAKKNRKKKRKNKNPKGFKPHMMYKGDSAIMANTFAEHKALEKKGYTHKKPKTA